MYYYLLSKNLLLFNIKPKTCVHINFYSEFGKYESDWCRFGKMSSVSEYKVAQMNTFENPSV